MLGYGTQRQGLFTAWSIWRRVLFGGNTKRSGSVGKGVPRSAKLRLGGARLGSVWRDRARIGKGCLQRYHFSMRSDFGGNTNRQDTAWKGKVRSGAARADVAL